MYAEYYSIVVQGISYVPHGKKFSRINFVKNKFLENFPSLILLCVMWSFMIKVKLPCFSDIHKPRQIPED